MPDLTPAQSVETLSFEAILQAQKDDLISRDPKLKQVLALTSETLTKMLENFAYRELHLRARINDGIKATMVATATGFDLDNLLLLLSVKRLTIAPADSTAIPPVLAVMETDDDYRKRGLLVFESFSTAGPRLGYVYHAMSVTGVRDIYASSPSNGVVDITVLAKTGVANKALIDQVTERLSDEKVRPLGTQLVVRSATPVNYQIIAELKLDSTPRSALGLSAAKIAIEKVVEANFKIGKNIYMSGIYAALHSEFVSRVTLKMPLSDIAIGAKQFGNNTLISVIEKS